MFFSIRPRFSMGNLNKATNNKIEDKIAVDGNSTLMNCEASVEIEEQALNDMTTSTKDWEERFESWGNEWRNMVKEFSFDRVKSTAYALSRKMSHPDDDDDDEERSVLSIELSGFQSSEIDSDVSQFSDSYQQLAASVNIREVSDNEGNDDGEYSDVESEISEMDNVSTCADLTRDVSIDMLTSPRGSHLYRLLCTNL